MKTMQKLKLLDKSSDVFKAVKTSIELVMASCKNTQVFIVASTMLLASVLPSLTTFLQKNIVDSAAYVYEGSKEQSMKGIILLLVAYLFAELVAIISNSISTVYSYRCFAETVDNVQQKLVSKCCRIKLGYFNNSAFINKLQWATNEMPARIQNVVMDSISLVGLLISIISLFSFLMSINPLITVLVIIGSIPVIILFSKQTTEQFEYNIWNASELRKQWCYYSTTWQRTSVKEVKFWGILDYLIDKWHEKVGLLWAKRRSIIVKYSSLQAGGKVFMYFMVTLALVLVCRDISAGRTGVGTFVLVYGMVQSLQLAFINIFKCLTRIADSGKYIFDWKEIMEYEEEDSNERSLDSKNNGSIEFKNVTFSYPETEKPILKNINISVKPGEKIAIVGENGSGKSTFVSLVCGLYDPNEGDVIVSGVNIKYNLNIVRRNISCALQDYVKYEMSIADNIKVGDPDRTIPLDEVEKVTDTLGFHEHVSQLSEGYDTHLGTLTIKSIDLSGGQWQKVILSRALIKKNSEILILDEPTAALDPISESKLYKEFSELTGDRTVILISHRLGATKLADRILVFDNGTIAEEGNHEFLMQLNGKYAEMYRAQAKWYA